VIASVRPCPPVPPSNLHGKEAVPGSSPGGGLITCKTAVFCDSESLLIKEGLASRLPGRLGRGRKVPANRRLSDAVEHLRAAEGLDGLAAIGLIQSRWKTRRSASPLRPPSNVGDRFWGAERGRTVPHASNGAERGVRK
jgi:hypothetical protein